MKQEQMQPRTVLFDILPIMQLKHGMYPDYRFVCLLPYVSDDVRLCALDTYHNEAVLLYAYEQKEVIGKQFKNGHYVALYPEIAVSDHKVMHFRMNCMRLEQSILTVTFDYMQDQERLDGFFRFISILVKSGLKLAYQLKKLQALEEISLHKMTDRFDEDRFTEEKIFKSLHADEEAYGAFSTISAIFFTSDDKRQAFVNGIINIGLNMRAHIDLPLVYPEN